MPYPTFYIDTKKSSPHLQNHTLGEEQEVWIREKKSEEQEQ